jgi:hypothetical protein
MTQSFLAAAWLVFLIAFIYYLWNRCHHKWEVKGWVVTPHYRADTLAEARTQLPDNYETKATLVCTKCGKIETKTFLDSYADPRK